jgi:hypothetical protein
VGWLLGQGSWILSEAQLAHWPVPELYLTSSVHARAAFVLHLRQHWRPGRSSDAVVARRTSEAAWHWALATDCMRSGALQTARQRRRQLTHKGRAGEGFLQTAALGGTEEASR